LASEEQYTSSEASYKDIVLDTEEDRVELERTNALSANIYLESNYGLLELPENIDAVKVMLVERSR